MRATGVIGVILLSVAFGLRAPLGQRRTANPQTTFQKKNHPPTIESFTTSDKILDLCPWAPMGTCGYQSKTFALEVKARDPDGDALSYKYSVTGGRIKGKSALVDWDLEDVGIGTYSATVEVTDGKGGQASASVSIIVRPCGTCDPPPCPVVNVSCPDLAVEGERVVFQSSVIGSEKKVTYSWKITNGSIIKGEGSPTIEAEVGSSASEYVTATVTVRGLPPACQLEASCSCKIQKRKP